MLNKGETTLFGPPSTIFAGGAWVIGFALIRRSAPRHVACSRSFHQQPHVPLGPPHRPPSFYLIPSRVFTAQLPRSELHTTTLSSFRVLTIHAQRLAGDGRRQPRVNLPCRRPPAVRGTHPRCKGLGGLPQARVKHSSQLLPFTAVAAITGSGAVSCSSGTATSSRCQHCNPTVRSAASTHTGELRPVVRGATTAARGATTGGEKSCDSVPGVLELVVRGATIACTRSWNPVSDLLEPTLANAGTRVSGVLGTGARYPTCWNRWCAVMRPRAPEPTPPCPTCWNWRRRMLVQERPTYRNRCPACWNGRPAMLEPTPTSAATGCLQMVTGQDGKLRAVRDVGTSGGFCCDRK